MRDSTFAHPLDNAIQRHTHAVEQLRKVAHYYDHDLMGRLPSDSEAQDYKLRSREVDDSLQKICGSPCPDLVTLRRKAKYLDKVLRDQSLGQRGERALITSILQMPRKGDVNE